MSTSPMAESPEQLEFSDAAESSKCDAIECQKEEEYTWWIKCESQWCENEEIHREETTNYASVACLTKQVSKQQTRSANEHPKDTPVVG